MKRRSTRAVAGPKNLVSIPSRDMRFSLLYSTQTGFGVHPVLLSSRYGWGFSSKGLKLTIHLQLAARLITMELYPHSPHTSWLSDQLIKDTDNLTSY
jgi:hypothetical protein